MKKFLVGVTVVFSLFIASQAWAETWINDYGFYENANEISAKDRLIGSVDNIFDYESSKNPGGEKIENGRYYIETKYKGGYNGTDADYVYLDEFVGKDGTKGDTGERGEPGIKGDRGDTGPTGASGRDGKQGEVGPTGEKGNTGDTGKDGKEGEQGLPGEPGKGLEDRAELIGEVRILDTKRTTWSVYAGRDFNNKVGIFGAKVVVKLGRSYEERRLDELEARLNKLKSQTVSENIEVVPTTTGFRIKVNN